jgi:hypothetical protein
MQVFINQFSFLLTALIAVGLLAFFLLRDGVKENDLLALAALLLGFVLAFFLLQPGPGTFPNAEIVIDQIGTGTPVLLEFLSPY